jgi:hypothetical protein
MWQFGSLYEAVEKAHACDAIEPPDDGRTQRIVEIEQQVSVGREAVGEQHPAAPSS